MLHLTNKDPLNPYLDDASAQQVGTHLSIAISLDFDHSECRASIQKIFSSIGIIDELVQEWEKAFTQKKIVAEFENQGWFNFVRSQGFLSNIFEKN